MNNGDLRCECGHLLDEHYIFNDDLARCENNGDCYCSNFEPDKYQNFGKHPATPIEIKAVTV